MKTHLITFGNLGSWYKTALRLRKEAEYSELFDHCFAYNETNLSDDFLRKNKRFLEINKRGFGFWIWKSQIVRQHLELIGENDIVIYLDAGCTINREGQQRLKQYLEIVNQSQHGNLSFPLQYTKEDGKLYPHLESWWTKKSVLYQFPDITSDSHQLVGGAFLIRKNRITNTLVNDWVRLSGNYTNINDEILNESPEFRGHRHDQSLFSLLRKRHGTFTTEIDETYPLKMSEDTADFTNSRKYPFHASRRKEKELLPRLWRRLAEVVRHLKQPHTS